MLENWRRTVMCGEVTEVMAGQTVRLNGWVQRTRNLGGVIFVWLRDYTGIVQAVFNTETAGTETFAVGESLRGEYVVALEGEVALRAEKDINDTMATGKIEVIVRQVKLLNAAATPPIYIDDKVDENEAVRLKYRYLDLRRPSMQHMLRLRHRVVSAIHRYLDGEGFTEVETPILTKSTPEGARDFLVPSRIHAGSFYALPQSPQIYKQLLMLGGLDKYYQIARCFRDEDSRADRQPEFTQLDMEMSFVQPEDVQAVIEGMTAYVMQDVMDYEVQLPLRRITWQQAMDTYGSDKPDTRFDMKLVDVTDIVKKSGFGVFEKAASVRGINAKGAGLELSRKEIDALGELAKTYHAKGLAWLTLDSEGLVKGSSFAKFFTDEAMAALLAAMDVGAGDALFFVADEPLVACNALGQLRLHLGRKFGLIDDSVYDLLWVTEFPLLEWDEEAGRFVAMHHPFTSPMDEDAHLLETDPGKARAKAYDLVLNGFELGGGSIRIHESAMQERMFSLLGFTQEEAWFRFGFLLEAFKYGTPPHGGCALGMDRLAMILAGGDSLRDVIAFPKVQNASDLMMQAPSIVAPDQLEMLHIALDLPKEGA
ncbi:aspartate--tRNA ligase [Eubacteriales bacterium OttesenSCG-928-A19]|nr:aspartate--tRNA ligase [Eubacteriales bacterium OttesenSCG-928-A19]